MGKPLALQYLVIGPDEDILTCSTINNKHLLFLCSLLMFCVLTLSLQTEGPESCDGPVCSGAGVVSWLGACSQRGGALPGGEDELTEKGGM